MKRATCHDMFLRRLQGTGQDRTGRACDEDRVGWGFCVYQYLHRKDGRGMAVCVSALAWLGRMGYVGVYSCEVLGYGIGWDGFGRTRCLVDLGTTLCTAIW